ncbi:MAG TPA: Hsp20/alpha crystallin family protein [Acidisphaera sp.]|nr:Hsp20/alpha crystallin family protein [Acidisphaera sp.]
MANNPVTIQRRPGAMTAPSDSWAGLRSDFDRLFDQLTGTFGLPRFGLPSMPAAAMPAVPAIDVAEDDKAYTLTAELPGLTEKEIEVSLSGDMLTIKGEKRQEHEEKTKDYLVSERSYGEFRRAFTLPDAVARDKVEASFANGVLKIVMPKRQEEAPKSIPVKPAAWPSLPVPTGSGQPCRLPGATLRPVSSARNTLPQPRMQPCNARLFHVAVIRDCALPRGSVAV